MRKEAKEKLNTPDQGPDQDHLHLEVEVKVLTPETREDVEDLIVEVIPEIAIGN